MGQLFWKFLAAFWFALLLAFGGIYVLNQVSSQSDNVKPMPASPTGRLLINSAQDIIDSAGLDLFKRMLQHAQQEPGARGQLFVVNGQGQDILGRSVPKRALQHVGHVRLANEQALELFWFNRFEFDERPNLDEHTPTPPSWPPSAVTKPRDGTDHFSPGPPKPRFWLHPIFLFGAVVLTSMAVSFWLAWYFAAPVRQLKQALGALPQQQWQTQLSRNMTRRQDEFGALARSFNQMAQQVYQAIIAQRRLLHDVSHELRSPLARLQILIGLVRQQPDDLQQALAKVEAETARLDQLVGQILTFSRLESGELQPNLQPLLLQELLEAIVEDAVVEATPREQEVRLSTPVEPIWLVADVELLSRAVENILRNAIKYAGQGAHIDLQVRVDSDDSWPQRTKAQHWVCIVIRDNGLGVPEPQLSQLFAPFFRASSIGEGFGLGLSIALRAVQACGGDIQAQNIQHEGRCCGFEVRIFLPLETAAN